MKKATRAYKVGFTDGVNGKYHNTYVQGSTRHADYEKVTAMEKHHECR